jgi:hypothetical protein
MNKSPTGRAPTSPEIQELVNRTRSTDSVEVLLQLDYWALEARVLSMMEYQLERKGNTK